MARRRRAGRAKHPKRNRHTLPAAIIVAVVLAALLTLALTGFFGTDLSCTLPTESEIRSLGYSVLQSGTEFSTGEYPSVYRSFAIDNGGDIYVYVAKAGSNESAKAFFDRTRQIITNSAANQSSSTVLIDGSPLGSCSIYSRYPSVVQVNFASGSFVAAVRVYRGAADASRVYEIGKIVENRLK